MARVKGSMTKRWSPEQIQKADHTIEKMQETRQNDFVNLRDRIMKRLENIDADKKKTLTLLEQVKTQTNEINKRLLMLAGAESILKDLLKPTEENANSQDKI